MNVKSLEERTAFSVPSCVSEAIPIPAKMLRVISHIVCSRLPAWLAICRLPPAFILESRGSLLNKLVNKPCSRTAGALL